MAPKRPHPSLQPKKRARLQLPGEEADPYEVISIENSAIAVAQGDVPQDQTAALVVTGDAQVAQQSAPTQPQHLVPQSTVTQEQLTEDNSVDISQQDIYGDLQDDASLVRTSQSPKANKPRKNRSPLKPEHEQIVMQAFEKAYEEYASQITHSQDDEDAYQDSSDPKCWDLRIWKEVYEGAWKSVHQMESRSDFGTVDTVKEFYFNNRKTYRHLKSVLNSIPGIEFNTKTGAFSNLSDEAMTILSGQKNMIRFLGNSKRPFLLTDYFDKLDSGAVKGWFRKVRKEAPNLSSLIRDSQTVVGTLPPGINAMNVARNSVASSSLVPINKEPSEELGNETIETSDLSQQLVRSAPNSIWQRKPQEVPEENSDQKGWFTRLVESGKFSNEELEALLVHISSKNARPSLALELSKDNDQELFLKAKYLSGFLKKEKEEQSSSPFATPSQQ